MAKNVSTPNLTIKNEEMGIGTWAWGDSMFWGYGKSYGDSDLEATFHYCVDAGIRLFDTAEAYGNGKSESILGRLIKTTDMPLKIATKFMPYPWRLSKTEVLRALSRSLKRLDLPKVDLYQIHWPFPPLPIEVWLDGMIEAKKRDLVNEVGVSNYDLDQMTRAFDRMASAGFTLTSNQVPYNLLDRRIEKNGVMKKAKELGIKIIAYSPLAQGVLTGKYSVDHPLTGMRGFRYNRQLLIRAQPLLETLAKVGASRGGKTASQVALNWTIQKGTLPIPGAKSIQQAELNLGALNWKLTDDEMAVLDDMSDRVAS